MEVTIKLGKEGEEMQTRTLLLEGCECRMASFVKDLQEFANDWIRAADREESRKDVLERARARARAGGVIAATEEWPTRPSPCRGCPEA